MDRVVRPWTADDVESVRTVLRRTWEAAYGGFIPANDLQGYLDSAYAPEALRRIMQDPATTGFVGCVGRAVVAMLRVRNDAAEDRTYVSSVYVLPEEQSHGWGRRLMALAAEQAVAAGRREIWLGVMTQNAPAVAWYRRHGFVAVREEPFTMGRTIVQHLIGHLPVEAFLSASHA